MDRFIDFVHVLVQHERPASHTRSHVGMLVYLTDNLQMQVHLTERIFIEILTSDRQVKASRAGSKCIYYLVSESRLPHKTVNFTF